MTALGTELELLELDLLEQLELLELKPASSPRHATPRLSTQSRAALDASNGSSLVKRSPFSA